MTSDPLGDPVRVEHVRSIAPGRFLSTWANGTPIMCGLRSHRIDTDLFPGMQGFTPPPPEVVAFLFGHLTQDGSAWVPALDGAYVAWSN